MRRALLIAALSLTGCVEHPLVDMTDIDPVSYQAVYDRCEASSVGTSKGGPILVGVIMGASVGMGLAAVIVGAAPGISAAEGWGALSGAGAGAAAGSIPNPVTGPPENYQSISDCLTQHGYKLLPAQG
jgi:hypothetical protein